MTQRRTVAPAQVRDQLGQDLADGYYEMVQALRDGMSAQGAWLTCKACGKKALCDAPDHKTRIQAVEKWVELGLGKRQHDPDPEPADLLARQIDALNPTERRELAHWLQKRYPALSQTLADPSRATRPSEEGD